MVWFCKSLKASDKCRSSSLRRLALSEASVVVPALVSAPLARLSKAGSLATSSCSSNGSCDASIRPAEQQLQQQQIREHLRQRSLPAMHLAEQRSSLMNSCAVMANPPVFDNPLRRRGCCNHKHSHSLSSYRAEAIERELRVKQIYYGERPVMAVVV